MQRSSAQTCIVFSQSAGNKSNFFLQAVYARGTHDLYGFLQATYGYAQLPATAVVPASLVPSALSVKSDCDSRGFTFFTSQVSYVSLVLDLFGSEVL